VRPTVRSGGSLVTSIGRLAIDDIRRVAPDEITDDEAARAGEPSRAALLAALGQRPGEIHRIAFRLAGADPRIALREDARLSPTDRSALQARLSRMDGKAPWTARVLELIAEHPGRRAGDLAPLVGLETPEFKRRVRRLKALGLTISLEVGYRLSPRGEALRNAL
jgi:hypothetical protein